MQKQKSLKYLVDVRGLDQWCFGINELAFSRAPLSNNLRIRSVPRSLQVQLFRTGSRTEFFSQVKYGWYIEGQTPDNH